MPCLKNVTLISCNKLIDKDLPIFRYCESLKCVDISYCPGITEEGIKNAWKA